MQGGGGELFYRTLVEFLDCWKNCFVVLCFHIINDNDNTNMHEIVYDGENTLI